MEPLPTPPPELKALTPWITRGNELLKADPIIAYWCELRCERRELHSADAGTDLRLLFQVHSMQPSKASAQSPRAKSPRSC